MAETKYYDTDEAVRMLPLVTAYCRDIKDNYERAEELVGAAKRLSGMTALSKEKTAELEKLREEVRHELSLIKQRYDRWKEELGEMFITVCSARLGRVNIPVFCETIMSSVQFCVTPDTTEDNVEWHQPGESCEKAKPYFVEVT